MKTEARLNRVILAWLLCLCAGGVFAGCWAPPPAADLDEFIEYAMDFAKAPGLAAAIVKNGEVVWAKGYGWANIEEGIAVTPDTLFMTGSISKTVVGTAVMQLYEQGLIGLDADVNDYLPFSVRNPNHPDTPITARMLLTHTSSIIDLGLLDRVEFHLGFEEEDAIPPMTLHEFLEGYLAPGGQWYSETENFDTAAPGSRWIYGSISTTLEAHMVEVVSGQAFDEYCRENIFTPLGMDETSYRLSDLEMSHIAVRYSYDACITDYKPLPHVGVGHPAYPSVGLHTSAKEFARFIGAFMNGGELDGVRILKAETVEEMLTVSGVDIDPADPMQGVLGARGQGLSWMYVKRGGQEVPSHAGGLLGVVTNTLFLRDGSVGIVWFANGFPENPFALLARPNVHLDERLLEEAEKY